MHPDFRVLPQRPDLADAMWQVESLGTSCELGLVQRHCGAEPLGLFRFGSTPLDGLIAGLEDGFAQLADASRLTLHVDTVGEWISTHRGYGFEFHTGQLSSGSTAEAVRSKLGVHFAALRRMLLESLEEGHRLFVYRPEQPGSAGTGARALSAAMRRHGPAALMWVDLATGATPVRPVEWTVPGEIMTGYLDRFAPLRFAAGASFDSWTRLVTAGLKLLHRDGGPASLTARP